LFVVIAAIAIAIAAVGYRSIQFLVQDSRWVNETHQVLEILSSLHATLGEISAAQRGYIITREEKLLEPYHAALGHIDADLDRLAELTADSPTHQERLPLLRSKLGKRLAIAVDAIVTRRGDDGTAPAKLAISGEGEELIAEIREIIIAMEEDERRVLQLRTETAENTVHRTLVIGAAGATTTLLILLFVFLLIRRERTQRGQATARLTSSLEKMERLTRDVKLSSKMVELLQSCRTRAEAHSVIQKMAPQLLPEVAGAVCCIDSMQHLVESTVAWGNGKDTAAHDVFAPDDCWALRRGRPHVAEDSRIDLVCAHVLAAADRERALRGEQRVGESTPKAHLCLPMIAHGEALGVMYLRMEPEALTEEMRRLARALAEQISLALSNLKLQETLRAQSVRDPLTALFNRRYMEVSLQRELSHARRHDQPVGIVMLDVDHFKRLNDIHGHEAGDAALAECARVLRSLCRCEDIACRYGGEEFILIMPGAPLEAAVERAEHVRKAIKALRIEYRNQPLGQITASFGVAVFSVHGDGTDDIIRSADAALYRAKQRGRDRVVVAESVEKIALPAPA
jgi:diguanylate cyclase (GGDEF)-like protein